MAIGIIGVVRLLPVGLRASKSSEMLSRAAFLAQEKLEELKLAGWTAVNEPSVPLEGEHGRYSWMAKICEVSLEGLSSGDDIRRLSLTVSWREKDRPRAQEFVTYIGK